MHSLLQFPPGISSVSQSQWPDSSPPAAALPAEHVSPVSKPEALASARRPATRLWRQRFASFFAQDAVLPHELFFGAFLLVTWLRLLLKQGLLHPLACLFLACGLGAVAVAVWTRRAPTPTRWRVRLLYYPALLGVTFYAMTATVTALGLPLMDARLSAWDQALLGGQPALWMERWLAPWLTELLAVAYMIFFPQLVAVPGAYCVRSLEKFRWCISGLFTLYALGFLGYTLLPARGPYHQILFAQPLEGWWVSSWALPLFNVASNGVDVFPSIHVAASFYLLAFDARHHRRRFWWLLVPCVLLWVSTVYLRYHYFVDLIAGFAIGLVGLAVARACEWARTQSFQNGQRT